MEPLFNAEGLIALATLTALEVVLGIDNIVFIAILSGRLPEEQQSKARRVGLLAAMATRILLLFSITWVMGLTKPLFSVAAHEFSWRDLILIFGGLFLLAKATYEIHHKLEGQTDEHGNKKVATFIGVITQVLLLDLVFSLDSVITAVGMADHVSIMVVAVVLAVGVMMIFANPISAFVERHPTMKILALSFLLLVGVMLIVEGFDKHVSKGYIYFAMAFSLMVELLNLRFHRKAGKPQSRLARKGAQR